MFLLELGSVSSQDGVLHTSMHMVAATHVVEGNSAVSSPAFELTTRTLNGTVPGPLLRLKPGDTLILDFYNDLEAGGKPHKHNQYSAPNESNLHFHGLHVSGELPSDDSTYVVGPGQSYRYVSQLPYDHMPGTHFIHPHRHGSTALQVGGGAAGAIIVEDDPKTSVLPPEILQAREILLVLQEMQLDRLKDVAKSAEDTIVNLQLLEQASGFDVTKEKFYLTNGQINPSVPLKPNEWVRLRIIHSGWLFGRLDIEIPGCDMQLIAKDGVYLPILPRKIERAEMVNAGRADIMVQCSFRNGTDQYPFISNHGGRPVVTLIKDTTSVNDTSEVATAIPTTQMEFPGYLQDLRNTPATPGCSCETRTGRLKYPVTDPTPTIGRGVYFHESFQGAIVERQLITGGHPYHQHVHPVQIVSGGDGDYYQTGDWQDVLEGSHLVRYSPTVFTGKMMIHCHRLDHEDKGMMHMEYIHPSSNPVCVCAKTPPLLPLWLIVVICCGGLAVLAVTGLYYYRRRAKLLEAAATEEPMQTQTQTVREGREEEERLQEQPPLFHLPPQQSFDHDVDPTQQQSFEMTDM